MNDRLQSATAHRIAFSDRLRMLLVHKDVLAPQHLADEVASRAKSPVTAQTAGNWLNGVQIPNHGNLIALAAFLSVTPEFLLEGSPVLQFAPAKHADVDTEQLVADFQKLDVRGRRLALAQMGCLARLMGGAG